MGWNEERREEKNSERREGGSEKESISDGKILKLPGVNLPIDMDPGHSCLRGTPTAPFDNLIHSFPIAFKDSFDAAVPAVFHPACYPQSERHLLSVVAEEDSLNPSFNDDPCPYFFHVNLRYDADEVIGDTHRDVSPRPLSLPTGRQGGRERERGLRSFEIITDFSLNQR